MFEHLLRIGELGGSSEAKAGIRWLVLAGQFDLAHFPVTPLIVRSQKMRPVSDKIAGS